MKKYSLIIIGILASFQIMAQDISVGAKGGINVATIAGDVNTGFKPNVYLGGFAQIELDKFTLQPELLFSGQGAYDRDNDNNNGRWVYNYLAIPVFAKFDLSDEFSLCVGPQISFLLSAQYRQEIEFQNFTEKETYDIEDDTENVDLLLAFGASYLVTDNVGVDLRFALSFMDHNERNWTNDVYKNQLIQIGGSYRF